MELTLVWAVLTAVGLAWLGLRIWPTHLPDHAFDRLLGAAVTGLLAGRVTAMALQGVNPVTNPADLIIVRGGVHTGVASLVFILALLWTTRTTPGGVDALAPSVVLGLAGWHAGCLWRGACLGSPSDLPWAWALEASPVTRHPVELYAAIGIALGAWLVSVLGWRAWARAGSALIVVSGFRLLTEPLRPSITGGPVGWYMAGVVVGITAIVVGRRLRSPASATPT